MRLWIAALTLSVTALPATVFPDHTVVASGRLLSRVAQVSSKGRLATEMKRTILALGKRDRRAKIVKLRAFIADSTTEDQIRGAVTSAFDEIQRPVLTIIRVGALPEGARVVLEATAEARRDVNPMGVAFISGQLSTAPKDANPDAPVKDLAERSVANLKSILSSVGSSPGRVARVTCFASALSDYSAVKSLLSSEFAASDINIVRIQKNADNREIECEAMAGLDRAPNGPVEIVNPTQAAFAQAALFNTPKMLLTGLVVGAGDPESAVKAAFEKLAGILSNAKSSMGNAAYAYAYPIDSTVLQKYRDIRFSYFDRKRAPASTNLVFEGLGDPAAKIGVELILTLQI